MAESNLSSRPVILIHGYLCLKEMLLPLQTRLEQGGVTTLTVDMPPLNLDDVQTLSQRFDTNLSTLLASRGDEKCDLVGVSLGGLIGLYYLKKLGGAARVRRFVAIGTPFQGTWVALAGVLAMGLWSAGVWQYLPGSALLQELNQGVLPHGVECYALSVQGDPFSPPERSILAGAQNLVIDMLDIPRPLRHQGLIFSKTVTAKLLDILRA